MRILSIDTSCDETAASVTEGRKVISNIIWSQAAAHAKFGGVMPSLAQRMHKERIDWVIDKALKKANTNLVDIEAIAVTIGPGLSIALGVGVDKAKELAKKYKKPLIPVNHIEAHLLSPLAEPYSRRAGSEIEFPALALCVSGGNTILALVNNIGEYEMLAQTVDDALGEALDKGARMLGLGYPGGAILEKMARLGDIKKYTLPVPLSGQEKRKIFSYSGLKTSFYRFIDSNKKNDPDFPSKEDVFSLAATYQWTAFRHIEKVTDYCLRNLTNIPKSLLLGGGVAANVELKLLLRNLGKKFGFRLHIPYTKKLCGDNAAMIGVTAFLKISEEKSNLQDFKDVEAIDRNPRLKLIK